MLVLTRHRNERVLAGPITITVLRVSSEAVRLGFHAPAEWPIHREEVLQAIAAKDPHELLQLGYEINAAGLAVPLRDFAA